jgi:hypothetical protein
MPGDFPAAVYRFRTLQEVETLVSACGFEISGQLRSPTDDSIALLHATRNHGEP